MIETCFWISKDKNIKESDKESNQEGTVNKKGLFLQERIEIVKTSIFPAQGYVVRKLYHNGLQYG